MKRSLCVGVLLTLATVGAAADEMSTAPSVYITGPTSSLPWTGFYFGGNAGYGLGQSTVSYTPNDPASLAGTCGGVGRGLCVPSSEYTRQGGLAGGQIGYNYQMNAMWVVGLEADLQWTDLQGSANSAFRLGNAGDASIVANETINSFGTLRARMGVVPVNPLFVYGTGGLAYGRVSENFAVPTTASGSVTAGGFSYLCTAGSPACFAGSSARTAFGWTGGAGAEYAITNNLILKTEVLWVNLGPPSATLVALNAVTGTTPSSIAASFTSTTFTVVRAGLNFKFYSAANP